MLKQLCKLNGASGNENKVREFITSKIKADYVVDNLGSVIAFVGDDSDCKKVSINAHMDEVGFIITGITDEGYLRFSPVGGIDPRVCLDRVVETENGVKGVIGDKAFHLLSGDEKSKCPDFESLLIDIGAIDKKQAEEVVSLGDYAYFVSEYIEFGDGYIKAKALDDRIGCMLMIDMINEGIEGTYCFNVQEEVGLRGAKCTAENTCPDIAIILESTTAADLDGVSGADRVCVLGDGPVISFMDGRTIYDKQLYNLAMQTAKEIGIPVQTKTAIAGGNDAGAIQTASGGTRVLAISLPTRYIHSGASVVKKSDIEATKLLIKE
ncbi:MAG: M42 family metallopeptidase, partial [Eubacterium sp.]